MLIRTQSQALFDKAKTYFPGGVSSPVRAFKSVGGTPLFIEKGDGPYIWDADGNRFLDFCCSWGPLILGHNHPHIRQAIIEAVSKGTSFGAPTKAENELAELILSQHRYLEKMRFVSSGTEAVMSAIRLARGYTKRNKVLKFEGCYHGHSDSLLVKAGSGLVTFGETSSAGVPQSFVQETLVLPLNNPQALQQAFAEYGQDIACVIVEPIPANNGLLLQDASFLRCLRLTCYQYGALLIFDEVISGFRIGFEGAAGHYDIRPDLITFGKIIGGGMPVGAYGGKAEIMACVSPEGPVYQAGTLSGNPVAMAAGKAALEILSQTDFYPNLAAKTSLLVEALRQYIQQRGYPMQVKQLGSLFWPAFARENIQAAEDIDHKTMDKFRIFHAELLERGIYLGPSGYEVGFVSAAHTEAQLTWAAEQMKEALDKCF